MTAKTTHSDLINHARNLVIEHRQMNCVITNPISLLQRHFLLGYKDALDLLEQLKMKGMISEEIKKTNSYIVHAQQSD